MYNPSNHIPLSKPLGAAAFPIDGKFMFYTNGVGGVYSYRPFQSVQEVLDYFPLGSNFRGNVAGQSWAFEVLVNTGGTLSSDGGSIVGGVNDVYWWRNGVTDADLVLKASGGSASSVIHRSFTIPESDITDGVVSLVGRTNDQGDQIIPSKATWAVETQDDSVARYSNSTQTVDGLGSGGIEVYLVGIEGVEPLPLFEFTNTTPTVLNYSLNGGELSFLNNNENIPIRGGDTLILSFQTEPSQEHNLANQNGLIMGEDGQYPIQTIPRTFVIPLDSIYAYITLPE